MSIPLLGVIIGWEIRQLHLENNKSRLPHGRRTDVDKLYSHIMCRIISCNRDIIS